MTLEEFSNEFDVLYNNITSNQAPGLDEYEKSVLLTKAQEEILLAYFDPRGNKVMEGFDGSERRQIDFSMVVETASFRAEYGEYLITYAYPPAGFPDNPTSRSAAELIERATFIRNKDNNEREEDLEELVRIGKYEKYDYLIDSTNSTLNNRTVCTLYMPVNIKFDYRDNSTLVFVEKDILMFINEYVEVQRDGKTVRLVVVPIDYMNYSRLMSKPFKRPLKGQAWRLLESNNNLKAAEIIVGPNDYFKKYVIRYVKRPRPIILENVESDLTINGISGPSECELDPIIHHELLQRAVEHAKAIYTGDLSAQIALGSSSQTQIGVVPQSNK